MNIEDEDTVGDFLAGDTRQGPQDRSGDAQDDRGDPEPSGLVDAGLGEVEGHAEGGVGVEKDESEPGEDALEPQVNTGGTPANVQDWTPDGAQRVRVRSPPHGRNHTAREKPAAGRDGAEGGGSAEKQAENEAEAEEFAGQCTARSKQSQKRCRRVSTPGRTVCYYHGGKSPRGIASATYRGKGYSKELPKGLKKKYEEAMSDPELLSLRSEVALLHVRIGELVTRLGTGETSELWARLMEVSDALWASIQAGDIEKFVSGVQDLRRVVKEGMGYEAAWKELADAVEKKQNLAAREWRRQVDMHQVITSERAMTLIVAIMEAVRENVHDRRALMAIQDRVSLLTRNGAETRGEEDFEASLGDERKG